MTNQLKIRMSALPLAFLCAGSIRAPTIPLNETNEPARNGTASHLLFRNLVAVGTIDWDAIDPTCDDIGADSEEVRHLCGCAQRLWPKVAQYFPRAMSEVTVAARLTVDLDANELVATGTADIISVSGTEVHGADWKTGWKDANYAHQMKGYLAAILLEYPQLERGTMTVLWLREQEIENYSMTREDAIAWKQRLIDEVVNWDGVYHPGEHCGFCKRHVECSAANALTRAAVASLANIDLGSIEQTIMAMQPDRLHEVYSKAKLVGKVAEKALDAIKLRVINNGPIEHGGKVLAVSEESRRQVDVERAWAILQEALTDSELAACIKISLSKVEDAVGKNAGRGNGAKAKEALGKKLEQAEAVSKKPFTKLVTRRS